MKIRSGFVTNSSSTSYLCIFKINGTKDEIKENFGKFGENMLKDYIYTDINDMINDIREWEYWDDNICDNCPDYDDDCSENCQREWDDSNSRPYFENRYLKLDPSAMYLAGYSCQGYGGEYDASDDRAVTIGNLLSDYKLATRVYAGDPY